MDIEKEIEKFKVKYSDIACNSINQFIGLDAGNIELQEAVNDLQINLSNGWLALTDFLNVLQLVKVCNERISYIKATMFINNPNYYQKALPDVKEADQNIINEFVPIDLSEDEYNKENAAPNQPKPVSVEQPIEKSNIEATKEIEIPNANTQVDKPVSVAAPTAASNENVNTQPLVTNNEPKKETTPTPAEVKAEIGNQPLIKENSMVTSTPIAAPVVPAVEPGNQPLIPTDSMVAATPIAAPVVPAVEPGNQPLIPTDSMVTSTPLAAPVVPAVETGNQPLIPTDSMVAATPIAAPVVPAVEPGNQPLIPTDNMVAATPIAAPVVPAVEPGNQPLIPTDNMVAATPIAAPVVPAVESGNQPLIPMDNVGTSAPIVPAAGNDNQPLIPLVGMNTQQNQTGLVPTISVGGEMPLESFTPNNSNQLLMPTQPIASAPQNNDAQPKEVYKRATTNPPKAILVELNQFNNLAMSRETQKGKIKTIAVAINLESAMKQAQDLYASGQVEQAEKIMNMIKVKTQPANN